jgi:hypothetical protein
MKTKKIFLLLISIILSIVGFSQSDVSAINNVNTNYVIKAAYVDGANQHDVYYELNALSARTG